MDVTYQKLQAALAAVESRIHQIDTELESLQERARALQTERLCEQHTADAFRQVLSDNASSDDAGGVEQLDKTRPGSHISLKSRTTGGRYKDLCARELASVYPNGLSSREITQHLSRVANGINRKSVSSALSTLKSEGLASHDGEKYALTEKGTVLFRSSPAN